MVKKVIHFLKLVRFQNLLIVALTQYLMRWCVIYPVFKLQDIVFELSELNFFLLVLSTVLITASGYIINDYFDRKTDLINRPDSVVVGVHINRRLAMILHIAFSSIAVIIGTYLSFLIGHWKFSFLFIITAGILWFYSTTYKRMFLIGNLIVATLTALVPALVAIFELPIHYDHYSDLINKGFINYDQIKLWITGYAIFAFLTTFIREIIKDIEDEEGDNAFGRSTIPVVIGSYYSKLIVCGLIILNVFALMLSYKIYIDDNFSLWYFILFLIFPFAYLLYYTYNSETKEQYHKAGLFAKIIMLLGLLYSVFIPFLYNAV